MPMEIFQTEGPQRVTCTLKHIENTAIPESNLVEIELTQGRTGVTIMLDEREFGGLMATFNRFYSLMLEGEPRTLTHTIHA